MVMTCCLTFLCFLDILGSLYNYTKNISQIEHKCHRSLQNFLINLLASISTYELQPKEPPLNLGNFDAACILV